MEQFVNCSHVDKGRNRKPSFSIELVKFNPFYQIVIGNTLGGRIPRI